MKQLLNIKNVHFLNFSIQGRANPGVQGVPRTRAAEIKGRQFFVMYDRVVY